MMMKEQVTASLIGKLLSFYCDYFNDKIKNIILHLSILIFTLNLCIELYFLNSVPSDSGDAESGFEETDPGETGIAVIRMVSRFVDRVCTEGGVSADHVRCLHQMVPGVVHMHIETLEAVYRESKTLPPIQKVFECRQLLFPFN